MEVLFVSLCLSLFFFIQSESSQNPTIKESAIYPPRGWTSYGAYNWVINEEDFMKNAQQLSSRLLDHGYEIAMVHSSWYRNVDNGSDNIDTWGRPFPDLKRWPSSANGTGFKDIAQRVHRLGLKFGIKIMGGISKIIFKRHTPILDIETGKQYFESHWWAADQIYTMPMWPCSTDENNFIHVNASLGAGKAYFKSLFQLFVDWDVDYVELESVFGEKDFDLDTITTISEIIKTLEKPIILSVSPGENATLEMSKQISGLVNMLNVGPTTWDDYGIMQGYSLYIASDYARAGLIGADGLRGNSWLNLGMLPFGRLTDPSKKEGPNRLTNLTLDEQKTLITLWAMAKSPIMYGGDLVRLPLQTFALLVHPILTEISYYSSNNIEFENEPDDVVQCWIATGRTAGKVYVAILSPLSYTWQINVRLQNIGSLIKDHPFKDCKGRDIWNEYNKVADGYAQAIIHKHGCALFVLDCF